MTEFQGYLKKKRYFEGWYFKHVQNGRMLAFIPGIQLDASGRGSAFLQVLTDRGAHQCEYPLSDFHVRRSGLGIKVGESVFTARGAKLSLQTDGLSCTGTLRYGPMTPLHGDIMGPLRFVPFLQCNHGIRSLWHTVDGHVRVNGEDYVFDKGEGYIEKDWGRSFPRSYVWAQCGGLGRGRSVTVAAADVPLGPVHLPGCIAVVQDGGEQIRFATYRGGRIMRMDPHSVLLRQGKDYLSVCVEEGGAGHALRAPKGGEMSRTVRERPLCPARIRFYRDEKLIFDERGRMASFEYAAE